MKMKMSNIWVIWYWRMPLPHDTSLAVFTCAGSWSTPHAVPWRSSSWCSERSAGPEPRSWCGSLLWSNKTAQVSLTLDMVILPELQNMQSKIQRKTGEKEKLEFPPIFLSIGTKVRTLQHDHSFKQHTTISGLCPTRSTDEHRCKAWQFILQHMTGLMYGRLSKGYSKCFKSEQPGVHLHPNIIYLC